MQKGGILVSRIPDISGRKSGHFQIIAAKLSIFLHKKVPTLLIFETVQLQMRKIEKKTSICSILWVILWQNSADTRFGHFLVEYRDTGRKKSFCNSALSDRHDQTKTDRVLWSFSTGPQQTNLNLQTGLRSIGCSVVEKSRFSDRG